MLQQQLKEANRDKKSQSTKFQKHKAQYLELKRIYTESSPQSNELLFHDR